MDRLFLDANVQFSAAYREGSGLLRLWQLAEAELVTSSYALLEAQRNLEPGQQRERLSTLTEALRQVSETRRTALPAGIEIASKDLPILTAAIASRSTHLLTGDRRHFGHLFGQRVSGVQVVTPRDYLSRSG